MNSRHPEMYITDFMFNCRTTLTVLSYNLFYEYTSFVLKASVHCSVIKSNFRTSFCDEFTSTLPVTLSFNLNNSSAFIVFPP